MSNKKKDRVTGTSAGTGGNTISSMDTSTAAGMQAYINAGGADYKGQLGTFHKGSDGVTYFQAAGGTSRVRVTEISGSGKTVKSGGKKAKKSSAKKSTGGSASGGGFDLGGFISAQRASGQSWAKIASSLNSKGVKTASGRGKWHGSSVSSYAKGSKKGGKKK